MTARKIKELVKREKPMTITPFHEMDEWFEDLWRKPFSLVGPSLLSGLRIPHELDLSLSVDIYEEGKDIVMKTDLPGVKKEDLKIDLAENLLTISGEKKKTEKIEHEDYHRYERSYGSFSRKFELPGNLDTTKIKAHFEDGVLELRIPKTRETSKKHRKITIE